MRTMEEACARSDAIEGRLEEILGEFRKSRGQPDRAIELMEEAAQLLIEVRAVYRELEFLDDLESCECSGPH